MTTKTTPKNPDVSEIEVKDADVHSLVSRWMDDTTSDTEDNSTTGLREEEQDEEEEVRMPRVGLGAEDKAERSAWKTHEAAAEKLAPGAHGVAQKLLQQGRQARRLGAGGRAGRGDDEDDGDSRLGSIVKLSAKKKSVQRDAVTKIIEEKQKKRERKAAAKAAKEAGVSANDTTAQAQEKEEEKKEVEESLGDAGQPAEKKAKTGEAFADGEDFISLPPAERSVPEWKKRGGQGEGGRKKERYVRPENVAPRTAKIRYQTTADGQTRKRTKTRSKQKNLRRDHRPLEKKPTTIPLAPQNTHKTFADDDD